MFLSIQYIFGEEIMGCSICYIWFDAEKQVGAEASCICGEITQKP